MRTKDEKETIILFNEAEDTATVYTHNARLKNKLYQMRQKYPDHCTFLSENGDGGVTYRIDKSMVSVRKPYDEQRREKDRLRALADNRILNTRKDV